MKRVTTIVVLIVALVAVGPRPAVDVPDANAIAQRVPTELTHIPAYLAQEESAVTGIHANTEKRVVWAVGDGIDSTPHRTPKSVVYLHGFSATRQETAPFSETLARALGANLFETRLAGHGLPGASMNGVTAQDWLGDAVEALTIGQRIGDSVIVVATSTGGTLAVWLATQPIEQRRGLQSLVLISPNIAIKDPTARILTWPWMQSILPRVIPERHWTSHNAEQERYWTTTYPSTVLFPMAGLVSHVRHTDPARYTTPTLLFTNAGDDVVDAGATATFFDGVHNAAVERVAITPRAGEDHHVIVGRIVSPSQVTPFLERTLTFLRATHTPSSASSPR